MENHVVSRNGKSVLCGSKFEVVARANFSNICGGKMGRVVTAGYSWSTNSNYDRIGLYPQRSKHHTCSLYSVGVGSDWTSCIRGIDYKYRL